MTNLVHSVWSSRLCRFGMPALLALWSFATALPAAEPAGKAMTLAVMDPLAAPLSCDCVKGYAQRDYEKLGSYLEKQLGRKTHVVFGEDLAKAIKASPTGRLDLIVGKQSVVKFDAAECRLTIRPLAMLAGKDGSTTLTGLFVVPSGDPAKNLADLKGYRILFGPADSDEKYAAAIEALKKAGVEVPEKPETRSGCSDAALDMLDNKTQERMAGVISSYAKPLLEGCGTVPPKAIRVVGQTAEVPFITVYATGMVSAEAERKILGALLAAGKDPELLKALETKEGFVGIPGAAAKTGGTPVTGGAPAVQDWPGWRGPLRDGRVPRLPAVLPLSPAVLWKKSLSGAGLSGLAVTREAVLVADRDRLDQEDIFHCLDATSGKDLWKLQYPARGKLDYGNAPRATPTVHDGKAYLLGGFGDLHCVNVANGVVIWKKNLAREFDAKLVTWGMSASPLVVDDMLIVNPGAKLASLVALDLRDGTVRWKTVGAAAAYSSFVVGRFGGVRQIVGYDAISLGGWDPATGKRLWSLFPPQKGDFNVPTPIDLGGKLLVTTENNGTRLYEFTSAGKILPAPVAQFDDLAPDSSTPVVVDGKVFGCWRSLFCLDAAGLKPLWSGEDPAFEDYASLIADEDRVLITTARGELLLVNAKGQQYQCISRLRLFDGQGELISHPALVGNRLYVRGAGEVQCLELE